MTASPTPFAEGAVEMPGSEPGKATGSKMELVQPASADDPGRALWDKMQAEHDEQLSKHSMFQASAAMPSEEEIALLINTGIVVSFNAGVSDATAVYASIAKDLLALFAPILAEKERVEREWTSEKERADMAAAQMVKQNDRTRGLVALLDKQMGTPCEQIRHRQEVENLEARALAAEAAVDEWKERAGNSYEDGYQAALAQIAAPGAAMEEP